MQLSTSWYAALLLLPLLTEDLVVDVHNAV